MSRTFKRRAERLELLVVFQLKPRCFFFKELYTQKRKKVVFLEMRRDSSVFWRRESVEGLTLELSGAV